MKVLILGANGMLGHKMTQMLSEHFEVCGALRHLSNAGTLKSLAPKASFAGGVDAFQFDTITKIVAQFKPAVVVNCIGIIKQQAESYDPIHALTVNSILPHQLCNLCNAAGSRIIHFSTDCIFSGKKGMYTEKDESDASDLYGRSKFLGELGAEGCITLRTSIIGHELASRYGLLEWFLSNSGKTVKGFRKAIFSGFPTNSLAELVIKIIADHPGLTGVYNASTLPISKYDLLKLINDVYGANISIVPEDSLDLDRSLDSSAFSSQTGYKPIPWPALIEQMWKDSLIYRRNQK